jgi:hypothetical protein
VAGIVLIGRRPRIRHRGIAAYSATLLTGLMVFIIGLRIGILAVIPAVFVFGITISIFSLIWVNSVQELVPLEKLGRVFSIDQLGSFVLLPIGYGIAGWLTDRTSASTVFVMGGIATMLLIGIGLSRRAIRDLD